MYEQGMYEGKKPLKGSGKFKFDRSKNSGHVGSKGSDKDMRGNDYDQLKDHIEKEDQKKLDQQRCHKY